MLHKFTPQISRDETKGLRQTNIELMDRLKQLWECYKSLNPVFDPTAAQQSDSSTTISTIINPETQHNHITPFTDSTKHNNCMSMSNNTSFSCRTHHTHKDGDQPQDKIDAFPNNLPNTNNTEVAAVSSYTLTESCNNQTSNKFVIVTSNDEVEVIGNIFLISLSFSLSLFFQNIFSGRI